MDPRLTSAFWTLRIAFGLTALLAGLDKFLNLLTNWEKYASPLLLDVIPLSAGALMLTTGQYFDVAVRDLVMACGAFVLARLSEAREQRPAYSTKPVSSLRADPV